ncbi:MAG: tetratricopeptide repeat protein [Rhodobacteraceae bacterium]|nr:tetratricopeptide repeat protein [Paracoccaceae bacterium]
MLELGQSGGAAAQGELIKNTTEATFMADVVEASRAVPVIVDFWATWCGPCKTLGPMLEDAVRAARGKVRMVKVDIEAERRLAGVLAQQGVPLQSVPTVVAFHQGRPVDMFQGAVPQSRIKAFIDRLAALSGAGGAEALEAAEAMLTEGAVVDAMQAFAAILGEEPENPAAYGGLVRAQIAGGELDQAQGFLDGAPAAIADAPEVQAARAQLALARQAADAGPLGDLTAAVRAAPGNHQARFDYALALHAAGDTREAVEQLLELFRRDRDWNDGAARAQLFTIFNALKPEDPIVLAGRRKLSSMIFA